MRPDAKNAHAPRGKHWCYMHNDGEGAYLPKSAFNKNHTKYDGLEGRCRECSQRYRREADLDKHRNETTKTFRVPKRVHAIVKMAAQHRGIAIFELVMTSVRFYLTFACQEGKCSNPRGQNGRCAKHQLESIYKENAA